MHTELHGQPDVTVLRYFAAAKAAAGLGEESLDAATLAEALTLAENRHGARLAQVLAGCSFVVDGHPVGTRSHDTVALAPDAVVDCLPPFAGG